MHHFLICYLASQYGLEEGVMAHHTRAKKPIVKTEIKKDVLPMYIDEYEDILGPYIYKRHLRPRYHFKQYAKNPEFWKWS